MARVSFDLQAIARAEMLRQGFHPDFPPEVKQQTAALQSAPRNLDASVRDLRGLLWSSIDNSSSKDLDQIEFAEPVSDGTRLLVAIADVDADVGIGTPIDQHAESEATSVYVPGQVFPMLPEELSTGLTSLVCGQDRMAVVIEMIVKESGDLDGTNVFRAVVRNQFQLVYGRVGAWLEGRSPSPCDGASSELQQQLRLQEQVASRLRQQRHRLGALQFERTEAVPVIENGQIRGIEARQKNTASELIEDFMIAANEAMARTLSKCGIAALRRVVKSPERWPRIVQLAAARGSMLPHEADSAALAQFMASQRARDPDGYATCRFRL